MLRVLEVHAADHERVEFDFFVPIQIEWSFETLPPPVYWRTGFRSGSLLEFGLHRESGGLVSMTLVTAPSRTEISRRLITKALPVRSGVAVCLLDEWAHSNLLNEDLPLELMLGDDHVRLVLEPTSEAKWVASSGRVRVDVDSSERIILVEVADLTTEESAILRDALEHQERRQ